MRNCAGRDGYELTAWVLGNGYSNNGGRPCLGVSSVEHRLAAWHSLLNVRYRVVVSRQSDSRSARTLKDLELSCLLYCRLNLVVHSSMVTQILYNTCLLIHVCAHGAIIMAGELYGLQQNKQLHVSQVLSLSTSVTSGNCLTFRSSFQDKLEEIARDIGK